MLTRSIRPIFMCLLALSAQLAVAGNAGAEQVKLFRQAPDPEELAAVLFPEGKNKTRTLWMTGGTAAPGGSRMAAESTAPVIAAMLIRFDFNSWEITPESHASLDSLGTVLNSDRARNRRLLIEGHTDAVGSDEYNLWLSTKRAQAVRRYLIDRHLVDPDRLVTMGMGERQLLVNDRPNDADNRRVEFQPVM